MDSTHAAPGRRTSRARQLVLLTAALLVAGCSGSSPAAAPAPSTTPDTSSAAAPPAPSAASSPAPAASATAAVRQRTAPWGAGPLLPGHILVGYAGHEKARALGILGVGPLSTKGRQLARQSAPYAAEGRAVVPVFEFLATLAHASAGKDKTYRSRSDDAQIAKYLAAVRKVKGVLLLGIQPGRADFLPEVKAYERWLTEPDVGIALDPEWAVEPGKVPGRSFGHTTGSELDVVAAYLSQLVTAHALPEKVMVYHQLSPQIVSAEQRLHPHRGIVLVKSVDGIGSPGAKAGTYARVLKTIPKGVHPGFKLFFEEDLERGHRLMRPAEVLALRPRPVYVMYE